MEDNLIITMNVKCPKKTNHWAHLGRLLNFYKLYHCPLLEHTKDKWQPDAIGLVVDHHVHGGASDRHDQHHIGPIVG